MMLSGMVAAMLQNGQIWILGRDSGDGRALFLMPMLQPYFLLLIAIMEGLAVTNQVFSARSATQWPRKRVWQATLLLAAGGVLMISLLALGAHALVGSVPQLIGADMREVWPVLPGYLLSLIPLLCFEMANAALRGQGATVPGLVLSGVAAVINLAVCYGSLTVLRLGFMSVALGNLVSHGLALVPVYGLLWLRTREGERGPTGVFRARLLALVQDAGLPVFLTLVVAFASSAVLFPALKLRLLFVIPAVALGSAVAIRINQQLEGDPTQRRVLLREGLLLTACSYLVLVLLAWGVQPALMELMSQRSGVRQAGLQLLQWLLPTFFLTALNTMLQTLLEQLGRGRQVLIVTLLMEATLGLAILLGLSLGVSWVLGCMLASAVLYALIFLREVVCLHHALSEAGHAG
jgi:Na+-driven multidrug efflux pump